MSYVDGFHDKYKDIIRIVERINGNRQYVDYPADYTFYFNDEKFGKFHTIFGNKVSKLTTHNKKAYQKEKRMHQSMGLWESDISPLARCLENNYTNKEAPKLHTAFFDIEVDWNKERGFSPVTDPFNKITAISTYLQWDEQLITQVIAPFTLNEEEALEIVNKFDNCILYTDESKMLTDWLEIIEDADVLSGWNSETYDIPYIVNRISRVLSKEYTRRMCLWDKFPIKREFERFGKVNVTFDLVGRIHLDYLELYRQYTYSELHSYSLDSVGDHELGERKIAYHGSLDTLYNQDFEKFIQYNQQDTLLLNKLDKKLKYIDLANNIAHENTVLVPKAMSAVAVTEQAIINESHRLGLIVQDRKSSDDPDKKAAGAYVAYPKIGLHEWIGSVDINSLYPSVIRALNMGPETIIGQLRPTITKPYIEERIKDKVINGKSKKGMSFTEAWEGLFATFEYTAVMDKRSDITLTIDWENGQSQEMIASDIYNIMFSAECNWVLSANGTIFTLDRPGIIPGLLERWYAERKVMQKNKSNWKDLSAGIPIPEEYHDVPKIKLEHSVVLDFNKLREILDSGDKYLLETFMNQNNLSIEAGKIVHNDPKFVEDNLEYWDKRQLVKKIVLNSLYGAILNEFCRFFDKRIGQSTTLCGRTIAKHMDAYVNELLTGEYDHVGETIIYGDTDSCYFSAWPVIKDRVESGEMEWNTEMAIELYDGIGEQVNDSFPGMMKKAFHCPKKYGEIIKCARETVASAGLFSKKKRYALMVVDDEGKRCDVKGKPGKVKVTGMDLKRSDTPVIVQDFLLEILKMTLNKKPVNDIIERIVEFKTEFKELPPWAKGAPKRVNKLTYYTTLEDAANKKGENARLPGHVRAGYNYNKLKAMNRDLMTLPVVDGTKVVVCRLKDNFYGYTSVALPVDIDESNIPEWFKKLPFDEEDMEGKNIDKKVDNLLGILKWDLKRKTDTGSTFNELF